MLLLNQSTNQSICVRRLKSHYVFINNSMRYRWNFANKTSFWNFQWVFSNETLIKTFTATMQKLLNCEISTFDEIRNWTLNFWLNFAEFVNWILSNLSIEWVSLFEFLSFSFSKIVFSISKRILMIFWKIFERRLLIYNNNKMIFEKIVFYISKVKKLIFIKYSSKKVCL